MADFEKIFDFGKNYYIEGCPVLVKAAVLLRLVQTDQYIAQIKFYNMCNERVLSIKYRLAGYDALGETVETLVGQIEIGAGRGNQYDYFGDRDAIIFSSKAVRSYDIQITDVVCENSIIWTNGQNNMLEKLTEPVRIEEVLDSKELAGLYHELAGRKGDMYLPVDSMGIHICSCGTILKSKDEVCYCCGHTDEFYQELLDNDRLQVKYDEIQEKESTEEAEEKVTALKSRKKILKVGVYVAIAIVVMIIVTLFITFKPEPAFYDSGGVRWVMREYKLAEMILGGEENDDSKMRVGATDTDIIYLFISKGVDKDESDAVKKAFIKVTSGSSIVSTLYANDILDFLEENLSEDNVPYGVSGYDKASFYQKGNLIYSLMVSEDEELYRCWVEE